MDGTPDARRQLCRWAGRPAICGPFVLSRHEFAGARTTDRREFGFDSERLKCSSSRLGSPIGAELAGAVKPFILSTEEGVLWIGRATAGGKLSVLGNVPATPGRSAKDSS